MAEERTKAIVIDNGSFMCKAGDAGDDAPLCTFPAVIRRNKCLGYISIDFIDVYVGYEAQA